MDLYTTGRHTYPRGPVAKEIKSKLIGMIKSSGGKEELLADDIIELIFVARNDKDGFRAANRLLDKLKSVK